MTRVSFHRRAVLATAAALATFSLASATAHADGPLEPGTDPAVTKTATVTDTDAVRTYWTDHRLEDAAGEHIDAATLPPPGPLLTDGGDRLGYARPRQPYMRYGTRATGKIAMLDETGRPSNCSAAAIGGDLVLTAAHCAIDPADPSQLTTHVAFIPEYGDRGHYHPFGVWPVTTTYVPTAYIQKTKNSENFPLDVAVMRVAPDPQGATLEEALGTSYKFIQSKTGAPATAAVYGYPGQGGPKFDKGPEMFYCVADLEDDGQTPVSEMRTGNCAVQGGNSGGPLFDKNWNIVGVTQSGTTLNAGGEPAGDGEKGVYENSVFARLHPDTFGRVYSEAKNDSD